MLPLISIRTPVFPIAEVHPAIFLDRDDTLIPDHPYLSDPDGVELFPDVCQALAKFRDAGWRIFLVSNQSGIGRKMFTAGRLMAVHHRLVTLMAAEGVQFDGAYYCPHAPEEGCDCRKPGAGMLLQAMQDFATDTEKSIMVGDRDGDVKAGKAAGLRTALVQTCGKPRGETDADFVFSDLTDAARTLLA